jgi:3D (Asp-Asp-Asp) domain-containing protein
VSWVAVVSTAYCLSGTMADGTPVRAGSVANNHLRLGTTIQVSASPTRRRSFVVRDRIGWGTELDFWVPSCAQALLWGRRIVQLRVRNLRAERELRMEALVQIRIHHERAAALAQRYAHELARPPDNAVHVPPEAR